MTIFAVVVLSSLLLFFAVLIDYARIAAMESMTENAARSAVRSVLSAYDEGLYEGYGLFGRGGTEGGEIFAGVMEGNRGTDAISDKNAFRILSTRVESTELLPSSMLGEHAVFAREVLEEEKYKAPVDLTLEVISKFVPLASSLKSSTNEVRTLEQLRKLYEEREALLEQALKEQRLAAELSSDSLLLAAVGIKEGSRSAADLEAGFPEYAKLAARLSEVSAALLELSDQLHAEEAISQAKQADDGEATDENSDMASIKHKIQELQLQSQAISAEMAAFEHELLLFSQKVREEINQLEQSHNERLAEANRKLEGAEQLNSQMKRVLEQSEQAAAASYDSVNRQEVPGAQRFEASELDEASAKDWTEEGKRLLRETSWFQAYSNEINGQGTELSSFTNRMEKLLLAMNASLSKIRRERSYDGSIRSNIDEAKSSYGPYKMNYVNPASALQKREALLEDGIKDKLEEQEAQTRSLWKTAGKMLNGLSFAEDNDEYQALFHEVEKRYEQNLSFNRQIAVADEQARVEESGISPDNAHEAAEQSSSLTDSLFSGLSGMLEHSRNALYFGEYSASRFSYFEPQRMRSFYESGDPGEIAQAASFYNQEVEYVLYGFDHPLGNIMAAYSELFGVRLAIRTMEGLIESRSLGHPLLVLSAALIYGLEKTIEDMLSFAEKGEAPVSKYVKANLSYADYLRLFMLMHGGADSKRLSRMIAVIEQENQVTLSTVPAGVTGQAAVSIKLWFLPGIMKQLERFDLLKGKVTGGRYEATTTIGSSY
ncbi:hypothetical protein [Paenibacillus sp. HB172176]|uniref:hypothetical protein n=1 Tax=Paenibacillus sp. HB172176 TaxID=2493690 RepID=UPI00143C96D0|nr:hypothetical protein [Paenibacillus sp. HB172176]